MDYSSESEYTDGEYSDYTDDGYSDNDLPEYTGKVRCGEELNFQPLLLNWLEKLIKHKFDLIF